MNILLKNTALYSLLLILIQNYLIIKCFFIRFFSTFIHEFRKIVKDTNCMLHQIQKIVMCDACTQVPPPHSLSLSLSRPSVLSLTSHSFLPCSCLTPISFSPHFTSFSLYLTLSLNPLSPLFFSPSHTLSLSPHSLFFSFIPSLSLSLAHSHCQKKTTNFFLLR